MFEEILENESVKSNTKGGLYFDTTYNANLDLFSLSGRFMDSDKLINLFNFAYKENEKLAVANLLFLLDIRDGRGERRIFKTLFKKLCEMNSVYAKKVMELIPSLGRYDYLLEAYGTPLWAEALNLIRETIKSDLNSCHPSLLAKWMPSLRTHNKNNPLAKELAKSLGMSEKEYRLLLSNLRRKLNVLECNLTNNDYAKIEYSEVPSHAMKNHHSLFLEKDRERFISYLEEVKKGKSKINSKVLAPYDLIKEMLLAQLLSDSQENIDLIDSMWAAQKDCLEGDETNVLVIADTSGSMWGYNKIPISSSLGLAIYVAERNKGIFHNKFINFSDNPTFQELKGDKLSEKIKSIDMENWGFNTNIDKALKLILNASVKSPKEECPTHLVIISDMEFDASISKEPNYDYWKKEYEKHGIEMPRVIFWQVSPCPDGSPINKNHAGTAIINGFSPAIFQNILNVDETTPVNIMIETLKKYVDMIK